MNRGDWWVTVHVVTESDRTGRLSTDQGFVLFCFAYNNPTLKFQYHNGCFFNFGSFVLICYINSTYSTVNYNMMKKANFLPSIPDTTLTLVLFSSMHLIFIKIPAPVNILHG